MNYKGKEYALVTVIGKVKYYRSTESYAGRGLSDEIELGSNGKITKVKIKDKVKIK